MDRALNNLHGDLRNDLCPEKIRQISLRCMVSYKKFDILFNISAFAVIFLKLRDRILGHSSRKPLPSDVYTSLEGNVFHSRQNYWVSFSYL